MNIKRILSSALTVVMVFTAVVAVIPARASAAHSSSVATESIYTQEQIKAIVQESYSYNFNNAQEMLNYELGKGYLDYVSSTGSKYTMYLNRYTGVLYYVNNSTGEILTSNPYNPMYISTMTESLRMDFMSQLSIKLVEASNESRVHEYNSAKWGAEYAQIKVSAISGGLRVNYTLGDTSARFLLPGAMLAEKYDKYILKPMIEYYVDKLNEFCSELDPDYNFDFFAEETFNGKEIYNEDGLINTNVVRSYLVSVLSKYSKLLKANSYEKKVLDGIDSNLNTFMMKYKLSKKQITDANGDKVEANVYTLTATTTVDKRLASNTIRLYCPDYTMQMMLEHEAEVGFQNVVEQKPVFRCSLEYTFNSDGSLKVRLPANSITFDETVYNLEYVNYFKYFGAGNIADEGYMFVPDGSGAIIEYSDFYNDNDKQNISMSLELYGPDYCYSMIESTFAHREQITMPVYGVVSKTDANATIEAATGKTEVDTGYFAVIEDGASLSSMQIMLGGGSHRFGNIYTVLRPFPSDRIDISASLSVSGAKSYTLVSDSKYNGSYVTRYVMLSDADVGNAAARAGKIDKFYTTSYTGMAECYRDLLISNGTLTALQDAEEDLPLYIEAFGSMEIVKKILTFPVTVSLALTTFEDITAMYDDLAKAKDILLKKAEEYDAMAKAEVENLRLKANYEEKAANYRALSEKVYNITNVNFKLTGFANGGMYFTYPSKVKWESVCGGKGGFNQLLADVKERNDKGLGFSVYPEFDFQYINNTAMFDGISNKGNVSKKVDNRYASKQAYDSSTNLFATLYAMVVSADVIDGFYDKFMKSYSKYDIDNISVSTLGSDLNSNFDSENPINRDEAEGYIVALLDKMVNTNKQSVMVSSANIYAVKYAEHIIDVATDSSHFKYSSYSIPFTGLVLHGFVNYAGSALNYSGSPEYDILHAIENGASMYYLLSYRNTEFMKEDPTLNKYYGVNYETWFDTLVEQYAILNNAIGDLQEYNIVDHKTLIAERVIDDSEFEANLKTLREELLAMIEEQINNKVDEAYDSMFGDSANDGRGVKVTVDKDALLLQATEILNVTLEELTATDFDEKLDAIKVAYEAEYAGTSNDPCAVAFSSVDYVSKYKYITDSYALDENYEYTEYTVDNNLVTMVTYVHPETKDTVVFFINYNIYTVKITLDENTTIELGKYDFVRIPERGAN